MKRGIHFICILLALGLVQVAFAAGKTGPRLEAIRFQSRAPGEEQVIFRLNSIRIPKVFAIKGKNPRVVFDFPDTSVAGTIASATETNGRFIRRIRMGLHGPPHPKARVVLDLVPGADVDFRQQFDRKHGSLIVTLFSDGAGAAKKTGGTSPSTPPGEKKPASVAEKKVVAQPTVQTPPAPKAPESPRQPRQPAAPAKNPAATPATPPGPTQPARVAPPAAPVTKPVKSPPTVPVARKNTEQAIAAGEKKNSRATESASTTGAVLRSIKFDKSSNRGEMVLFKLNAFHPPVVFGIEEGVPRVVCDFKGATADAGIKNRIIAGGRYVRTIRVGRHRNPDKVRVVLDLEPNRNYDLQQVFFKDDNLFVIIINTAGNAPSRKEIEKPLDKKPAG